MFLLMFACTPSPNALSRPNRVAVGADGTVFVSDFQHDRIVEFAPNGAFRRAFGSTGLGEGQFWRITAMTVARGGDLLVVNRRPAAVEQDATGSWFELVRLRKGAEQERVVLAVPPDAWIEAIAETEEGTLVVADSRGGRLTEFDPRGRTVLGAFGPFSADAFSSRAPSALVVDGDTLWVVEQHRHRIVQIDRRRELRRLEWGEDSDRPRFPSAVARCEGFLVVADYGHHRVQRYSRGGRLLHTFVPAPAAADRPAQLMDLRADAGCDRLYLVDSKGDRVLVTDLNGAVLDELWAW